MSAPTNRSGLFNSEEVVVAIALLITRTAAQAQPRLTARVGGTSAALPPGLYPATQNECV